MLSNVIASSLTSCRLAPLTIRDSGTPAPSTNKLRLLPFFPPIRGVVAHRFLRQWRFALCPINALPFPSNPFHLVILGQTSLPQRQEKSLPAPALKMFVNRTGAAERLGQRLPLASGPQHINNAGEDLPVAQRFAPTTGTPLVMLARPACRRFGNQGFDVLPEFIRNFPRLRF